LVVPVNHGHVELAAVVAHAIVAVVTFKVRVDPRHSCVGIKDVCSNPSCFGVCLARFEATESVQFSVYILVVSSRKVADRFVEVAIVVGDGVAGVFCVHEAQSWLRVVLVTAVRICVGVGKNI